MLIGLYFKRRRLEKGLSETAVAALISPNFQNSLLWDFESGDDTDIDGWSVRDFKRYCEVLDIAPAEYANIPVSDLKSLPLSALIKTRREEMKYSIKELSNLIGYEDSVIQAIEEEQEDIVVVLDVIKHLSMVLGIPFQLLLEKI